MDKKIKKILLVIIIIGVVITGCGSSSKAYDEASPMENSMAKEEMGESVDIDAQVGFSGESPMPIKLRM